MTFLARRNETFFLNFSIKKKPPNDFSSLREVDGVKSLFGKLLHYSLVPQDLFSTTLILFTNEDARLG